MSKGIITLCGSTRFYKLFDEMNYLFTINDFIVLSIGCHSNSDYCLGLNQIEKAKDMLDRLHKEKIAMSHAVLVLNAENYIGKSTQSEIDYAMMIGKPVYYYWSQGHEELMRQNFNK